MPNHDLSPIRNILADITNKSRTHLLPILHAAQDVYGYIPEEVAAEIAMGLGIPLADVFGVIDFYTLFHTQPIGETIIHVCNDPACAMAGADAVFKRLSQDFLPRNNFSQVPNFTIEVGACLGLCEHAPAVLVKGHAVKAEQINPSSDLFNLPISRLKTVVGGDIHLLTKNCGKGHTISLQQYMQNGGYAALRSALQKKPADIILEVKTAGLVGRGGAAFPTGLKWEGAASSKSDIKYVVCNGDEAEPGTFKDRVLMEDDPHMIIEGLIIAAYAIGAQKGYFYIRGEYLNAYNCVKAALAEAMDGGYLGENILGSNFSFEIELRRGAGAYVCGEETALFESIEGKRGFPRIKPPFPTEAGLFGRPTVINNVETLANIALIINQGATEYRKIGTKDSPGPKLFCLSGDIQTPGLYEVPFGVSLQHIIFELAGGMRDDIPFQAALIGGAAGAMAGDNHLETKLSFEDLRAAGLPLGSGVITVFNANRDLREILLKIAKFFVDESCGKCFPCQIGTQRQYEIIKRISEGIVDPQDADRLEDVIATMTDASLCGLGQTAGSVIHSMLTNWQHLFSIQTESGGMNKGEVNA